MMDDRRTWVADLAKSYGRSVFAAAYRILGNPPDAEDISQEVFLKLLERGNRYADAETIRDMGPYLRVMASHGAIDLLRRRASWKQVNVEGTEEIIASADPDPLAVAGQKQKAELLRRALSSLSERDAKIFALRYFEEFSYEEIATRLKIGVNQVGVILHRARSRLLEILRPILEPELHPLENPQHRAVVKKENSHV